MAKVFLFADYSQAEARIVSWAGPIPPMKTWFQQDVDIHLEVAKLIGHAVDEHKLQDKMPKIRNKKGQLIRLWGNKDWKDLNNEDAERQTAKSCVHGNNYDMGPKKFAFVTGLPEKVAALVQDIYHGLFPQIRSGYHKWIEDQLLKNRTIYNPWGWRRTFYDIYGPELRRAAYAWYPQSTIGLLNIQTLVRCSEVFSSHRHEAQILSPAALRNMGLDVQLQVHDSVGVVIDDDEHLIADAARHIRQLGQHTFLIKGEELVIPLDFKIGPSWGDQVKYKIPEMT